MPDFAQFCKMMVAVFPSAEQAAASLRAMANALRVLNASLAITPEDTLRDAGIDDARQAEFQRKMSRALGGQP